MGRLMARDWWRCLLCAWRNHPLTSKRIFYAGTVGGVNQVDYWKACPCGKRSSGVERRRMQEPYPDVEQIRKKDAAVADLLSRGMW